MKAYEKELKLTNIEGVMNEVGVESQVELSESKNFIRLLGLIDRIDVKVLEKVLLAIPNVTNLIKQNQDFMLDGIKEQKDVSINAIESFNKTKDIIAENLRKDNLSFEETMALFKMLDKIDDRVEDIQIKTINSFKEYGQKGIKYGGFVALGVLAIVLKSGLDKNKE